MVSWWFYDQPKEGIDVNTLEWINTPSMPNRGSVFFNKMKNTYGFNTVDLVRHYINTPISTQPSTSILSDAQNSGLKTLLRCKEFDAASYSTSQFNSSNANMALNYYDDFNLIGYDIVDEPKIDGDIDPDHSSMIEMSEIIPYANAVREYDSDLLRFVDLLPAWAYKKDDYKYTEYYIQEYINKLKPNILAFNDYPIVYKIYKKRCFFRELYDIGSKSVLNSIPFIYTLTPFKTLYGSFSKSLEEFKYVIYGALIYGAKGLNYWPGFEWAVLSDETPYKLNYNQTVYNSLGELHAKLTNNSNLLLNLNFASAYHYSDISTIMDTTEEIQYFGYWNGQGGNPQSLNRPGCGIAKDEYAKFIFLNPEIPFTLISNGSSRSDWDNEEDFAVSFMTDFDNGIYFWIFNKNIIYGHNIILNLHPDNVDYVVDTLNNPTINIANQNSVYIGPGEAKLFKVRKKNPLSKIVVNISNTTYRLCNPSCDFNAAPFVSADSIIIGEEAINSSNGVGPVVFENGTYSTFMAHKIIVGSGVRMMAGSHVRLKGYTDTNIINQAQSIKKFNPNIEFFKEGVTDVGTDIKIYPNPIKDDFTIFVDIKERVDTEIKIFNNMGKL